MTSESKPSRGIGRAVFGCVLHIYFLMTRGLTLGVRAVVRTEDGKFLLVRHTYTPGWHFPGGGVEKAETAVSALEKELQQETGLELNGTPILHGVFHNSCVSKRDHVLVYRCDVTGRVLSTPTSPEIAEIGYFDLGDLPQDTDPGTIRRMREVVDGKAPCATW